MSVYLSEDEQLDMIRKWWNQYGHWVTSTFAGIMLVVVGYQWYVRHENSVSQSASFAYEELINSATTNDVATVKTSGKNILERFPGTPYADLTDMMLARFSVNAHDYKDAEQHLQHVFQNSNNKAMRQIARIRSVKLLLEENKPNDALALLAVVDDATFMPAINTAKGDCYRALKKMDDARSAYESALNTTPKNAVGRALLEMKLTDVQGAYA